MLITSGPSSYSTILLSYLVQTKCLTVQSYWGSDIGKSGPHFLLLLLSREGTIMWSSYFRHHAVQMVTPMYCNDIAMVRMWLNLDDHSDSREWKQMAKCVVGLQDVARSSAWHREIHGGRAFRASSHSQSEKREWLSESFPQT